MQHLAPERGRRDVGLPPLLGEQLVAVVEQERAKGRWLRHAGGEVEVALQGGPAPQQDALTAFGAGKLRGSLGDKVERLDGPLFQPGRLQGPVPGGERRSKAAEPVDQPFGLRLGIAARYAEEQQHL